MTGLAITLVLLSAGAHAGWNFLAKRSSTPEVFTWWLTVAGGVLALPVAAYLLITDPPTVTGWWFIAATVTLHTGYFFTLGRAYRHGDLSIVYPAARGGGIVLIPVLAVLFLGETMAWSAAAGTGLIVAGIFCIGLSSRGGNALSGLKHSIFQPGFLYAMATGLIIAAYSVVDKEGVQHVTPFLYMFMLSTGGGLGMLALISRHYPLATFKAEAMRHPRSIVAGAVLQYAAYVLVLSAFRLSPVSYVGPFREVGIVFGVALAAFILRERVTKARLAGVGAVATGAAAIALSP
ncbi:MAG: EamA family transporter [Dehalococcoidia bacterium]